ncbi:hypothetical protein ABZ705_09660 [Streptomyces sp. NPDC006984]|uniref:hypothetical protein n=1 Tax=Streptomyces sp. NPDC006984 TaxID=3155463 RepID=UPI0033E23BF2
MTSMFRLLVLLLGAAPPQPPMTGLLSLDAAAFARRVQVKRQPDETGHTTRGAGHDCALAGVRV